MNRRIDQLRSALDAQQLDGMFIVQPENRRYISGFTGTSGYVVITADKAFFITDFRYVDQAREQCVGYEIVNQGNALLPTLADLLKRQHVKRLGFEQDFVTYGDVQRYKTLEEVVPGLSLVPTSGVLELLRIIKDDSEVASIQRAADIADAAFTHILGYLRPGLSEKEVALELETFMRKQGASGPSFETIVASGWRSSLPHGVASDKVLESGDFVKMDYGAFYEGYCSDITRTVVLGKPSDKQREVYNVVLEAQRLALEAAKAGMTGQELDAVARSYIAGKGYGEAFGHSLGHGIGLQIHEGPRVSSSGSDLLKPQMVITIEPGIYLSQWGGVRIEDDVLLLEGGEKRIFTHSPKQELVSVG